MLSFEALAESAFRIQTEARLDLAQLNSLAFNDPKQLQKHIKKVTKEHRPAMSGDMLAAQLGQR